MLLTSYKIPNTFTNKSYDDFIKDLFLLRDEKYQEFNKKIIFTKYELIGIRVPILRKISTKLKNTNYLEISQFKKKKYFEEIFIEGILISQINNYQEYISKFKEFIKQIDNWAICDMCLSNTKVIKNNQDLFLKEIKNLLKSKEEYFVRVGVIALQYYYLDDQHIDEVFKLLDNIKTDKYYVEMAIAWTISIAYIKYKDKTLNYLTNNNLTSSIINKTIQKIKDSLRVSKEEKESINKYKK